VQTLAQGYVLAEAPVAGIEGELYFSDAVAGGVHRIDPDGTVTVVIPKRRGIGGMALHRDGGLVVTGRTVQHGDRELLGEEPGVTGYNDMGVAPDGAVWAGALTFRPAAGEEPTPGALFKGTQRVPTPSVRWPNGIGFSPDGATAYVADFADGRIHAGPVDGPLEPWARSPRGSADGLAVDEEGGVWVALGPGRGVARFSPGGTPEELLEVEADFVSSLCFAGQDLIITTATAVLRAPVGVGGHAIPLAG
jgi:sugar lactone lactonase YvrE